jgi:NTE family protein
MMGVLDSEEQKKNVDILIEPDVKDFPTFGFEMTESFITEGYIAAVGQLDAIKKLAGSQIAYNIKTPVAIPQVTDFEIADTKFPFIRSPFDVLAKFKYGHVQNGEVSLDRIESGISRIFGTKHFSNINYTFRTDKDDQKILAILAQPRKVNAISGTFNFMPSSGTSLIITNEARNLLNEPSVLYSTVRLAENFGVVLDYNYRLGTNKDYILSGF